ncbi:MAG: hypothetical protein GWN07_21880, partial [Actinobacteria bacterium]|nr:hypothetical protein [Actinomycetota bacterium]NIX22335.1 hypothetical protein [Actinomycetota bacterium]
MTRSRLVGLLLGAGFALVACSGDDGSDGGGGSADGAATEQPEAPDPTLALDDEVAFDEPVTIAAEDGSISAAEVA